jgi:hypothetical protein
MPAALLRVLMLAAIWELPGLREIAARFAGELGTANFSSLSPALRQPHLLLLVQAMARHLARRGPPPTPAQLVVVDSMALSLTRGRGRACAPLNDQTRGGGVLWAFWLKAPPGFGPLQVLSLMRGAWSDARLLRAAHLQGGGPLYLLDRNFYAIYLIERWLKRQVHFIVRARRNEVFFEPDTVCGPPRPLGELEVLRDEIGRLGQAGRRGGRPRVRLVWARLAGGEELILLSDQLGWGAGRLLAAYRQRQKVEQLHRWVKQEVGLAHLYSFQPVGLAVQLWTAVLLVLLIGRWLERAGQALRRLAGALKQLRVSVGLPATRWRPNTPPGHRAGHGAGQKGGDACVCSQNH